MSSLKTDSAQQTLEEEYVSLFSELALVFGNPPSHGAIFGLLFASERPLSMEEITNRLAISKGSASQGLRHLEEFKAITRSREDGERTHLYSARLELKPLVAGFLQTRLIPRLQEGQERLLRLRELLPGLPPGDQPGARLRLQRVTKWHKRATAFLPLAQKLLGD